MVQGSKKLNSAQAQSFKNVTGLVWRQVRSLWWFGFVVSDRRLYSVQLYTFAVFEALYGGMTANGIHVSEQMQVLFWINRKWTGCFFLLFPVKGKRLLFLTEAVKTGGVWPKKTREAVWFWTVWKFDLMWKQNKAKQQNYMCFTYVQVFFNKVLFEVLKGFNNNST